jgi:hypothetical protein
MARKPSRLEDGAEYGREEGKGCDGEVCVLLRLETVVVVVWWLVAVGWG